MAHLADSGIDQTDDGTPVVNAIAASVKQREAAVRLARQMNGPHTTKRLSHAAPPEGDIDGYREAYGAHVYPTVKSRRD